ncbi:hypothetical protein GMOD_00004649 [Pyrenophora seminiperda CCB06]|uniref:Uncharacterized protein n=1 Tax=Pyrenophora seminiperda CCB06 TaxID=1302712 RepID=A0A3M7MH52_9PLEO|nr:hypothetical protein GMOD_00004649 [Pyrenophora seminiperda CCB06]
MTPSLPLPMEVNKGATIAGILYYHCEIKSNFAKQIPIQQWSFEAVLAFFCSNTNKHLSFSTFFEATRARLYLSTYASYKKKATKVQEFYVMACAEHNDNFSFTRHSLKPTFYREQFIRELQKEPKDYEICTGTRNRGLLREQKRLINEWQAAQERLDPNDEQRYFLASVQLKEFFEGGPRNPDPKPENIPGVSSTDVIMLDVAKYQPYTNEYHILAGLLKETQGVYTYGAVDAMSDDVIDIQNANAVDVLDNIGLAITPVTGPPVTMTKDDLDHFCRVLTLNFE